MAPRHAVHLLGLCNLAAGALVASVPSALLQGADGAHTTAARLFGGSLAIMIVAAGGAGWFLPPEATRVYLWIFGVGVKVSAAVLWGALAVGTGAASLGVGAAADLAVALTITGILRASR